MVYLHFFHWKCNFVRQYLSIICLNPHFCRWNLVESSSECPLRYLKIPLKSFFIQWKLGCSHPKRWAGLDVLEAKLGGHPLIHPKALGPDGGTHGIQRFHMRRVASGSWMKSGREGTKLVELGELCNLRILTYVIYVHTIYIYIIGVCMYVFCAYTSMYYMYALVCIRVIAYIYINMDMHVDICT